MVNLQTSIVKTAGAYVRVNGLYIFTLGIHPHQGHTPVIRLGGHLDENETGWQCAVREANEEASIKIKPVFPNATYLTNGDHAEPQPMKITWTGSGYDGNVPFLATHYVRENQTLLSLMYLAATDDLPTPSSEVKGLLLMTQEDVHQVCKKQITLQQYLDEGGQAILRDYFNKDLPLEPFLQLRLLSRLLNKIGHAF